MVAVTGAVLLVRDVTELRKRDRLLLSKDATIREIHHRVKNNLQTISSLLRLQARRLSNPEAIAAVGESVRRIRTIALVHEALSREPGDDVTFLEIVRPLLRLAEEGLQSPDRPVRFTVLGDGGRIPAAIASPLSVVLTELLQNAVDHGFPEGSSGGSVVVRIDNRDDELGLSVIDDGRGVDSGFKLDHATGLGLSIVRTLVTTELNGRIDMRPLTAAEAEAARITTTPVRGHHRRARRSRSATDHLRAASRARRHAALRRSPDLHRADVSDSRAAPGGSDRVVRHATVTIDASWHTPRCSTLTDLATAAGRPCSCRRGGACSPPVARGS
jgi:two-component sensor histidine kinase